MTEHRQEGRQRPGREIGSDARLPPEARGRIAELLARVRDTWHREQLLVEAQSIPDDEPGVTFNVPEYRASDNQ